MSSSRYYFGFAKIGILECVFPVPSELPPSKSCTLVDFPPQASRNFTGHYDMARASYIGSSQMQSRSSSERLPMTPTSLLRIPHVPARILLHITRPLFIQRPLRNKFPIRSHRACHSRSGRPRNNFFRHLVYRLILPLYTLYRLSIIH